MKEINFPRVDTVCPECKHTHVITDPFHQETYCTRCGLIIQDNHTIPQITSEIRKVENQVKFIRSLWHK